MPQLEERKGSKDEKPVSRPYARMALLALDAGLTWRDMRRMKYTHLMQLLLEWEDMHRAEDEDEDEVVEATSADVKALARL